MNFIKLLILTVLIYFTIPDIQAQTWNQIGQKILGDTIGNRTGSEVSMPDPNTMAIASTYAQTNDTVTGQVRVYRLKNNVWVQKGIDLIGPMKSTEGNSISMPDSNTIAIGNTYVAGVGDYNQPAGQVQVRYWDGNKWKQKGQTIFGEKRGTFLGEAVSMPDPNTLAIGNSRHRERSRSGGSFESGCVKIYSYNKQADTWVQKGNRIIGDTSDYSKTDKMGNSVSMPDSNTIAIGAFTSEVNGQYSGAVRVYNYRNGNWVKKGSDFIGITGDYLGSDVKMPDANTLAFSVPRGNNDSGYVDVYRWKNNQWELKGRISNINLSRWISVTVDMPDTNTIAVGIPISNNGGEVRIYNWNNTWIQQGNTIIEKIGGRIGASISMPNSKNIITGAPLSNLNGQFSGVIRTFTFCDSSAIDVSITNNSPTLTANLSNATYQWLNCDSSYAVIPGETNQSFTASFNGNYAVEVSQGVCVDTSACVSVSVNNILEHAFKNQLSLYPNPTDGKLALKLDETYSTVTLSVNNIIGQTVLNKNYHSVDALEFDIVGKPGIYFIKVIANNKTAVFKIIKQ